MINALVFSYKQWALFMCNNSIMKKGLQILHPALGSWLRVITFSVLSVTFIVLVQKPQCDAMENKTGALFEEMLIHPGNPGKACWSIGSSTPPFLPLSFTFPVCLSPASGWISPVSLRTPSGESGHVKPESINHSAPAKRERRGVERKKPRDERREDEKCG